MSLPEQPEKQEVDYTGCTSGNNTYECTIRVTPYSGCLRQETFARNNKFTIKAMDFRSACETATVMARVIGLGHQVWMTEVQGVVRV